MAVQRENYQPSQLSLSGILPEAMDSLYRRLDGTWMFILRVDGEALLPDGRRVRISRHIGLAANEQIGRKPAMA